MKKFKTNRNKTGALTFIEGQRDVPFEIRRIYYIYDTEPEAHRGFHMHKKLQQYLVCVHGSCMILLDDGMTRRTVELNHPEEGLYVCSNVWREMYQFSKGAVLMVLASDYYDESDYIRNYDEFLKYVKKGEND